VARVRTVFFGSGPFALPALARLADEASRGAALVDLTAVITAPPRPAGRRDELQPTPVALAAEARGIPILTPVSLRRDEALSELRAIGADLIVLADYGRLIPATLLELPRHGALNLHPSLLPRHRGAAPVPAAILAGDAATGVTLMRMDEGLDSGPVLAQREVLLDGTEIAPDLEARLAVVAADLLVQMLPAWLAGTLEARPQPADGVTLTRPLRRNDGLLDPKRPAVELERQVRAYQPWPGSFLGSDGGRLIVWRAACIEGPDEAEVSDPAGVGVGALVSLGDSVALRTSRGLLRLDEVQPAGKRRMSGAEYRRGHRGS
jgi:methionyl-tRNA formyltransferase